MTEIQFPEIKVTLSSLDQTANVIVGVVTAELRKAGVDSQTIDRYVQQTRMGDWDYLIKTTKRWVTTS